MWDNAQSHYQDNTSRLKHYPRQSYRNKQNHLQQCIILLKQSLVPWQIELFCQSVVPSVCDIGLAEAQAYKKHTQTDRYHQDKGKQMDTHMLWVFSLPYVSRWYNSSTVVCNQRKPKLWHYINCLVLCQQLRTGKIKLPHLIINYNQHFDHTVVPLTALETGSP